MKTVSIPCKECGVTFEKMAVEFRKTERRGGNHFCSRIHAIQFNGRNRPKSGPAPKERPEKECGFCGKTFSSRKPHAKFCSADCSASSRRSPGGKSEDYNAYMRDYMLRRYHRRRKEWLKRLGGKCAECSTETDLQFDHVKAADKTFDLGKALSGWAEHRIEEEMAKCQILCRECHVAKTSRNADHGKGTTTHGMYWMYRKHKCRCELCLEAHARYMQEKREKRKSRK